MKEATLDTSIVVGVDFDNTLVSYDALFRRLTTERGLLRNHGTAGKRDVRDAVRLLQNGEMEWQKLQAAAYGSRIHEAEMTPGAADFLRICRQKGATVYIVSHKTEYSNVDGLRTSLRDAAWAWMANHRFFDPDAMGLLRDQVYFETTRRGKIERIRGLGCTHFVDDLEETFLEPSFPSKVVKILYAPLGGSVVPPNIKAAARWEDIANHVFSPAD